MNDMSQPDDHRDRDIESERTDWPTSAIVSGMTDAMESPAGRESESDLPALLRAVQANNRDAFAVLYDATVQRVFSLALRITRQQELAEEVVSDVYLQVWRQAVKYSPERGKVIAWLCVLCRSRALDALRRVNAANRRAGLETDAAAQAEAPDEPPDILQSVDRGSALHAALGRLDEQQRQLVALAYFRGFTHSELAAFMGMPIGTVKTQLRRAILRLKEMMLNPAGMSGEPDE